MFERMLDRAPRGAWRAFVLLWWCCLACLSPERALRPLSKASSALAVAFSDDSLDFARTPRLLKPAPSSVVVTIVLFVEVRRNTRRAALPLDAPRSMLLFDGTRRGLGRACFPLSSFAAATSFATLAGVHCEPSCAPDGGRYCTAPKRISADRTRHCPAQS